MATRTISNAGGNSNAVGAWAEGATPTASDDIVATATSGNLTINAALACRSVDLTGYVGTITHNAAITWSIGTTTVNGTTALKFPSSGWTYTLGNTGTSAISFVSTSATQVGITTGGKNLGSLTFNGAGGSWQLLDTLNNNVGGTITLTAGALDTNGQTVNTGGFSSNNSNTRSLTLGASTINIFFSGFTNWDFTTATGLTFNAGTSTINMCNAGTFQTFQGGGKTYNNVVFPTGVLNNTIAGSNTFNTLTVQPAVQMFIVAATTQTITTLSIVGTAGRQCGFKCSTPRSTATISIASGTVNMYYTTIQDIAFTGGATFNAYYCDPVDNITGITFSYSPNRLTNYQFARAGDGISISGGIR